MPQYLHRKERDAVSPPKISCCCDYYFNLKDTLLKSVSIINLKDWAGLFSGMKARFLLKV